jgi:methyl-accepting chemotaxis protein/sigma-B regulation protein RsbU (phosphoserine phosphatase)
MIKPIKFITKTLSVRISLKVVSAVATLLAVALFIMFHFSRKAIKAEARQKAEETLEGVVRQVDNVLLSVEQSAGNIYWDLLTHLNESERMFLYSRKMVETNPYVAGCAIAFEPDYYQERGRYFMAYVHHVNKDKLETVSSEIIQAETFGNVPYPEQIWYSKPVETGRPCWINPLKNDQAEGEAIITFSLPIYAQGGKVIGVLAVDLSLSLLSDIVLSAKPSPNSYATLLGSDGSFIVHPDSEKVLHKTIYMSDSYQTNKELREAEDAMVAGETGYKHFRLDGTDNYVFYKPFIRADVPGRSMERTGWSVGIIYPEDDIFGDYNQLLYMVIAIALVGLVLLMTGCQMITHRCLLPLRMLAKSSQRIAEGHYDEPVPDSHQWDEVGRLQDHFQQMQQALSVHIGELERLTTELRERNVVLAGAYEQAKDADRVKTAFLHNMTDQMIKPVSVIQSSVNMLCEHRQDMDQQEANKTEETIQEQGKIVTKLLNDLLDVSQEKMEE